MILSLRDLDEGDVPELHRLTNDMEIIRYMLWVPHSEEDTRAFVGDYRSQAWGIEASGALIGVCGLVPAPDKLTAEAWYLLDKPHWGKGYGTAALRRLLDVGFGQLEYHRIWATCLPENPASLRILEKAGMRREGFQRKNLLVHGEWKDSWLFARLREEWNR
jgi:[ribosomal protein S5]-alanine N-acetyltransferase